MSPGKSKAAEPEIAPRPRRVRRRERYHLLEEIGSGGMGTVYRAQDIELNRTVAVKVIRAELACDLTSLLRLKREIVLASRVSGRHVVRVHDFGEIAGQALVAMDWVDGESLAALLKRVHTLPPSQVSDLAKQICMALGDIHAAGIVHRDLKPGNLLIGRNGELLVADFGLARSSLPQEISLGTPGETSGTPRYMAPEQLAGLPADVRSDFYSYGIVLLEMLSGTTTLETLAPVRERVIACTGEKHIRSGELRKLAALDLVIRRCLQLDRNERYAQAHEILRDLQQADREAPAEPVPAPPSARPWFRSRAALGIAAGAMLLVLVCGSFFARRPAVSSADLYSRAMAHMTPASSAPELRLAARNLQQALRQSPGYLPAVRARLDVLLRLYETNAEPQLLADARDTLRRAGSTLDPSEHSLYFARIDLHAARYGEVIRNLKEARALLASSADANRLLGRALEASGNLSAALDFYRAAIRLSPESWACQNDLASVLMAMGHPAEAQAHFAEVIRLNPGSAAGYSNLGLAFLESGELDGAQQNFEAALERQPAPETYFNLGLTAYYARRYATALPFFESAIALRPPSDQYVAALAEAQWHAGQKAAARENYTRAMGLLDQLEHTRPLDANERCRRVICFLRLGDAESARAGLGVAASAASEDPTVFYTAALVAVAQGQKALAKVQIAHAIRHGYPVGLAKADPDLRDLF